MILLLCAALLVFAANAYCQFGGYHSYRYKSYNEMSGGEKKMSKRTYIGLSFPMMSLELQQKYQIDRSGTPGLPSVDTNIHMTRNSLTKFGLKGAIGIIGGSCFKIASTSEKSMIAVDVACSVEIYNWAIGTVKYSKTDSTIANIFCLQGSLPISLVYKTGPEVNFKSNNRVIFSIGGGIAPAAGATGYGQAASGGYFKIRPFLVSEIGIWGGIAAKLRFTYYPGTVNLINATGNDLPGYTTNGDLTVTANGSGNFVISLLLLPMTSRWENNSY